MPSRERSHWLDYVKTWMKAMVFRTLCGWYCFHPWEGTICRLAKDVYVMYFEVSKVSK